MRRLLKSFNANAHFFFRISGVVGVLLGWATMYFFDDWGHPIFWLLISLSVVLSGGGAWGGLAEQWGLKPLQNDPLGWRKAKQSYKSEPATEEDDTRDRQIKR